MMNYDRFIDRVEVLVSAKCSDQDAWMMVSQAASAGVFNDAYDDEGACTEAEANRIADYIIEQTIRDRAFLDRFIVPHVAGGDNG